MHIEASPSSFELLALNRPEQLDIHVAVCDQPRVVHYADTGNPAVRVPTAESACVFECARVPCDPCACSNMSRSMRRSVEQALVLGCCCVGCTPRAQ